MIIVAKYKWADAVKARWDSTTVIFRRFGLERFRIDRTGVSDEQIKEWVKRLHDNPPNDNR